MTTRFLSVSLVAMAAALIDPAGALAAGSAPPAGGAAIGQVVGATAAALVLTLALLALGLGHRSGRIRALGRAAAFTERVSGLPGWAALPVAIGTVGLLLAVFGLYWDVSLHIDNGRDPGPLANPAHYFILGGLFAIFAAGYFALVLPERRPGAAAIRIAGDWYAPVSGVLMTATATFALLGFPLDDVWHRLFGQDVTLWGPTHLVMLSGAALTLIGMLGLLVEGRLQTRSGRSDVRAGQGPLTGTPALLDAPWLRAVRLVSAFGGLLVGLSIYQGEFDFGVPQFRLLFHPILIAGAASLALVAARVLAGRGAALGTVVFYLGLRGILTLVVGPLFGESIPHFPLYIVEALLVEATALAVSTRRPYRFGSICAALIASLGVLAEYGWSHVWMPLPWPSHLLGAAIGLSLPVALAGATIGAFAGAALRVRPAGVVGLGPRLALGASVLTIAVVFGVLGHTSVPAQARLDVALTQVTPAPHRTVTMTVRVSPPELARGADWLAATAWQGHGRVIVDRLVRTGNDVWRTTRPIPVYGSWKALIRLARGQTLGSTPIYMPADAAIPAVGIPAAAHISRALQGDHKVLQRERSRDVPAWLWSAAGAFVLAYCGVLLALLAWGLQRLAASASEPSPPSTAPARRQQSVAPAGAA